MDESTPFDHDSLMYKLMKYLYKVEEQMESAPIVWIVVDIMQFATILVSLIGEVVKTQYLLQGQGLFSNSLNIFFNYTTVYDWLVISGAVSAFIVFLGIAIYLVIQYQKQIEKHRKRQVLTYCALTGTISIGLFEFFSQVMANNLINIVSGILNKQMQMGVDWIGLFLLNVGMMLFVSIFNSDRRIFRFCLVLVSLGLNMLPFTLTCILILGLSLYYQQMDKIIYKKLFYFIIIVTCVWCGFEMNDNTDYFLGSRFIYLGMSWIGIVLYFVHYKKSFMQDGSIEQNKYLVDLYKKKLKKQDKKQDYLLADQYFTRYYEKQNQDILSAQNRQNNREFYLMESVQQWNEVELKQRIIEKIRADRRQNSSMISSLGQIHYFEFLVELKVNMVSLLREVFQFMSQKKNANIQVIYQINKLANKIQKQFNQEMPTSQDQVLRVDAILHLQQLYQQFYTRYLVIVQLLEDIFDCLLKHNGKVYQTTQEKLALFTQEQKHIHKTLIQIQTITPNKLQTKLYTLLSQLWDNYQKDSPNVMLKNLQDNFNLNQQPMQKFAFSYVVISNKTIKYASIKFLSTYSYKQSYIIGENISMIFPSKFSLFIVQLLSKNADKKIFHSQLPVINQKGIFEIVNATFYLLPQFKGQITYIILFKKIPELQTKSLFLFNSETLCIEGFNKRIINRFKFSLDKINIVLENGAIQFSSLFVFNNQDKDFLTFTHKNSADLANRINKRVTETQNHDKTRQIERSSSMKAMLKMDYLSDLKKSTGKNVILEPQISFEINNISYKVIKVEDNSNDKINEPSIPNQRTEEINLIKGIHQKQINQLRKSTKDLKRKFENEQFFCPIPNPYLPKILQRLNSFDAPGRITNMIKVKIFFVMGLTIFIGGMIGIQISVANLQSSIIQYENEAQSLNRQYSNFMQCMLLAYKINQLQAFSVQARMYVQYYNGLSAQQADKFCIKQLEYLYQQKSDILKKFQDAYFDFPILQDTESVDVKIITPFFTLEGTSKTTLSYDVVVFLLDSSSLVIKKIVSTNFHLYTTLMRILRPDGRYNAKILLLQQTPGFILLAALVVMILLCVILYYWLYQLRETRQEIISIYQFIEKKQIFDAKKKVSEIQDLIQILSNNKKSQTQQNIQTLSRNQQFNTLSQLNSANNLNSSDNKMRRADSVKSFQDDTHSIENQNDFLLPGSNNQNEINKMSLKKKKVYVSQRFGILFETLIKYPLYFTLLILNLGVLFYTFYTLDAKSNHYIQAFEYFEKIRAANFQFRYLYAKSQELAFYESVMDSTFIDPDPIDQSDKKTHFEFEKPEGFVFSVDENLCSPINILNITDPWFQNYDCTQVDSKILTRDFSQAYEQYQRNLRKITNSTYQQIVDYPQLTKIYFESMYEFQVFKNYFNQLCQSNFQINIDYMGQKTQQMFKYLFNCVILWAFFSLLFVFFVTFPKLEAEISTIISLIKIIPSETLFNMKVASLIKKRDLLKKLSRL